ncbi:iron-containing alcohol dehydrogenase [Hoeflea poritis]|uniref:Iron-containing alcohol dehydrogenase n=1 Tax=Hoeflea poritis TaxID=2993659 RepID=A0ABT4VVH6_9HYPH|nr:iron-containing alcohol dehydrogenase [Hoeflea poritis]MDA4848698.1 iron-containing alcohol dehydrogenase [Hoeflea poritis]
MSEFYFDTCRSIRFGNGLLDFLGEIIEPLTRDKLLIVTDPGMMKTGIVDRAISSIKRSNIDFVVFQDVEADPPEHNILAAAGLAKAENAGGILGLGGGSSLDVAKLAALLAVGNERLSDIYGVGNARGPRLPLILVPTTAGTGSEVTPISIVTTGTHEKMGVVSPVILPDVAVLDPELTIGLPPHITAATGIDAMVHAIEAYASASANNNPISRTLAEKAMNLMGASLLIAVQDGKNAQARSDMLLGSMLAGQAFANSPVAAVHALAYPLGGHFHIPHGLSNALVLPHVLRFNAAAAPQSYAELAPHAFPELSEIDEQRRASVFIDKLKELSAQCGLQQSLSVMGIPADSLPMLADDAMKQTRLLVNNPREVTREDALAIYKDAY